MDFKFLKKALRGLFYLKRAAQMEQMSASIAAMVRMLCHLFQGISKAVLSICPLSNRLFKGTLQAMVMPKVPMM